MTTEAKQKNEQDYEYEVYVDGKLMWHGLNPEKVYEKIVAENPKKRVSLGWRLKEGILIAIF
ncbi:hypothetical protein HYU06_03985 [Candidatus Woesearchaeota archaeon]|nr:hypothetical protein [Candidatus Woesearchaeota archaeon]